MFAGTPYRTRRPNRDRFAICRKGWVCTYSYGLATSCHHGLRSTSFNVAHESYPVSASEPVHRTCRSFLRFCCGMNRPLFDPRPLRAAWRPNPVRLARLVRVSRNAVSACRFPQTSLALRTGSGPWVSPLARFFNPAPEGKTGMSRISFGRLMKQDDIHDQNRQFQ